MLPRFTVDDLSRASFAEAWRRDGVVVVDGFWSREDVERARSRAGELRVRCAERAPDTVFDARAQEHGEDDWFRDSGREIRAFFEPGMPGLVADRARWVNKLGHALHERDPTFASLLRSPRIAELAAVLGRPRGHMVQSMLIFKEAGIGDAVPVHQDAAYLATEPASVFGLWIALDSATEENGALEVAVGKHRGSLRSRYRRSRDRLWTDILDETPLECPDVLIAASPGTLVAFDGLLPHGSRTNRSDSPRWAVTAHVVSASARWCEDNWLASEGPFPVLGDVKDH